jgi:hypothetical protein
LSAEALAAEECVSVYYANTLDQKMNNTYFPYFFILLTTLPLFCMENVAVKTTSSKSAAAKFDDRINELAQEGKLMEHLSSSDYPFRVQMNGIATEILGHSPEGLMYKNYRYTLTLPDEKSKDGYVVSTVKHFLQNCTDKEIQGFDTLYFSVLSSVYTRLAQVYRHQFSGDRLCFEDVIEKNFARAYQENNDGVLHSVLEQAHMIYDSYENFSISPKARWYLVISDISTNYPEAADFINSLFFVDHSSESFLSCREKLDCFIDPSELKDEKK